jgi:hypothetical protein
MWGKLAVGALCVLGVAWLGFAAYVFATWPVPVADGSGGPQLEPWHIALAAGAFGLLLLVLARLVKDLSDAAEGFHEPDQRDKA